MQKFINSKQKTYKMNLKNGLNRWFDTISLNVNYS